MTSEIILAQLEDQQLRLHKEVYVTWRLNGFSYKSRGRIVALQPRQATVELLGNVGRNAEYTAGDCVNVPRGMDQQRQPAGGHIRKLREVPFIHKDFL